MSDYGLAESSYDAIQSMCERASNLYDEDNLIGASTIINEWTTETNACVLTYYLQDRLELVDDKMLYVSIENGNLIEGTFSFDPNALIDND